MKNPFSLAFEDGASERRFMARYADDNQDFYLLGAIAVLALQLAILVRNYIEPVALAGEVQVLVSGITLPATMLALVLLWRRRR